MMAGLLLKNRYQMNSLMGEGVMGNVFRGTDKYTNQSVVIKVLESEIVNAQPEMIERFSREAELLRQLDHPNIVEMLDEGIVDGCQYIVMEYVEGGDLRAFLKSHPGGLAQERVLRIAIEIADALTRTHHLGVIHRDIKPGNILLDLEGKPRLTDFGIAFQADKERLTKEGVIVGTVSYLSPEAIQGYSLDERADIWAFGVVLFEMLAGHPPFRGNTTWDVLSAILNEKLPDLAALREGVSADFVDLICRMLKKDRHERLHSVRQVGAEIEAIIKGFEIPYEPLLRDDQKTAFATPPPEGHRRVSNLPIPRTPFIGRENELAEISKIIDAPDARLISLTGPGGIGKTRLAIEVGMAEKGKFSDGVFFVSLAAVSNPDDIFTNISEAASFQFFHGVEPKQQIFDYFHKKKALLVLDNFEHLLEGANLISEILEAAPHVKALVTSRERLNLFGEIVVAIKGLTCPSGNSRQNLLDCNAVKLFLQAAKRTCPGFDFQAKESEYIAEICQLVDGMPLGIELAAAWVNTLEIKAIPAEIKRSIGFLDSNLRDVPDRHRSVRAVFDTTWKLLNEEEQQGFMNLSVFRGQSSRKALTEIIGAGLGILRTMVDKSILRQDQSGYYQIHGLLRQYGEEKLAGNPEAFSKIRQKHAEYYCDFFGSYQEISAGRYQYVIPEIDNVRQATDYLIENRKFALLGKILISWFYMIGARGWYLEGIRLAERVLTAMKDYEISSSEHQIVFSLAQLIDGYCWDQLGHRDEGYRLLLNSWGSFNLVMEPCVEKLFGQIVICSYPRIFEIEIVENLFNKCMAFAESGEQPWVAALANYVYAVRLRGINPSKGEKHFKAALQIYKQQNNDLGMFLVYGHLSNLEKDKGNFKKAWIYYQTGKKLMETLPENRMAEFEIN
ncbi:MAG: serine/threonine-protein kinase, partial [Anaerolineae bacterium]|nr:serine/threonine-protein kinase [Anaerolineae bacterium]